MFGSKERAKSAHFAADSVSIVAGGMKVIGDVESEHDMRIDGAIDGNVYCKARVVLGTTGIINGELHAANADIFGNINGNVVIKEMLCLKSKCTINGDLTVERLEIEPEAEFNGKCAMAHEGGGSTLTADKKGVLHEQF